MDWIFALYAFLLFSQALIWLALAWRWWIYKPSFESIAPEALSLIICARNEAANLEKNLPFWLAQVYPEAWELIIVDDASTDGTWDILQTWAAREPRLKPLRLSQKERSGKRPALQAGLAVAQYPWILLSDADCRPSSPAWAETMMRSRQADTDIVLGLGPYDKKPSWLNLWVQCETFYTAMLFMGASLAGQAYMGLGRNLLYRRHILVQTPWSDFEGIASGDDDLTLNYWAKRSQIRICTSPLARCYSPAPDTWFGLWRQKTRHYSASLHYPLSQKVLLGLVQGGIWANPLFGLGLLLNGYPFGLIGLAYLLILGLQALCWSLAGEKLEGEKNLKNFVFFSTFAPVYLSVFLPSLFFKPRNSWK